MDKLLTSLSSSKGEGGGEGEENGNENRGKIYDELVSLIKEDDNAVQGEHHLSILTEFICRDLLQSDSSTKEKCLTLLGTVLHSKHCATSLTPTQCTQITDALCAIINNNDTNTTIASNTTIRKLAVWCIEVQSLPPERLSAKMADSICKYALGSSAQVTESIEYEALGALDKLLFHADHLHLENTPDLWAPPIWQRAMSPSPQLRSRAYSILCTLSQDPVHLSDKLSKLLYTALGESLLSEYSSFISECQEKTYPVRLWGVFASLLGNRVLCGRTAQQFLRFQEGFFAHPAGEVRAAAFDSWKAPLRLFAHLQEKKKHQKLFGLFYKPFLFVIEKRVNDQPPPALVIDAALRTWKTFVPSLNKEMLVDKFDDLFTRFGFKITDLNSAHSCTVLEVFNGAVTLCNNLITNISTDTDINSSYSDILSGRIKRIADLIKSTLECEQQQDTQTVHKLCIDTFKTVTNALGDNVDCVKLFTEETLLNNTSLTTSYNTKFALDLFTQAVTPAKKSPKLATALALKLLQMPTFTSEDAQSERKTHNRALETFELFVEAVASTSPEELASVVTQIEESTLNAALVQDLWSALCTQVKAHSLSCDINADFCAGLLGMAFAFAGSGNEAETKCAEGDWDIMMAHFAGVSGLCEPLCTKMIQVCERVQVLPGRARFLASTFRSFVTHFGWDVGHSKNGCAFVLAAKLLGIAHMAVHDLGNAGWVKSVLETVGMLIKECSKELPEVVSTQDFSKVLGLWANEPLPQSTGKESDDDAVASVKEGMITLLESFLCATKSFFGLGKQVDLTILLCDMDEPLAGCLRSKHRRVKTAAVDTWNATFGANEKENFGYSPLVHSALTDLKRARTCLTLPCWKDRTTLISSPIKRSNSIENNNIAIRASKKINDFNEEEENLQEPPSQKKVKMTVESSNNERGTESLRPAEEEVRASQRHTSVVDNDDKETLSFGDVVEKDLCCSFSSAVDDFLQAGRRILNDPQAFANSDNGCAKEILQIALQVANKAVEELK